MKLANMQFAVPASLAAAALGIILFAGPQASMSPADAQDAQGSAAATASGQARGSGAGSDASKATQVAAAVGGLERAQIEEIVRAYLLENPEIMIEVQAALEQKMQLQQEEQLKLALANNAEQIFKASGAPVAGNPDGDVTVVEFFDYNCGFCRRALEGMSDLIEQDKNVKVVLKEMPIFGPDSEAAARIALAAGKQGKYWEVHRDLLTKPGRSNRAKAMKIAKDLGLDLAKLRADMNSPEVSGEIQRVQRLAQEMGIRGTPHFLIDDKVIPGSPEDLLDQLKARVAEVRKSGCKYC